MEWIVMTILNGEELSDVLCVAVFSHIATAIAKVKIKGRHMFKTLNPVIPGRVSDELYDNSIGKLNRNPEKYTLHYKTRIIHLIDSVSRGYTTPTAAHISLLDAGRPSPYARLLGKTIGETVYPF